MSYSLKLTPMSYQCTMHAARKRGIPAHPGAPGHPAPRVPSTPPVPAFPPSRSTQRPRCGRPAPRGCPRPPSAGRQGVSVCRDARVPRAARRSACRTATHLCRTPMNEPTGRLWPAFRHIHRPPRKRYPVPPGLSLPSVVPKFLLSDNKNITSADCERGTVVSLPVARFVPALLRRSSAGEDEHDQQIAGSHGRGPGRGSQPRASKAGAVGPVPRWRAGPAGSSAIARCWRIPA